MKGIAGREKRYVAVETLVSAEGVVSPTAVVWDDGRRFPIDAVLDVRRAASRLTGGDGMRYTVRVGRATTHLYYEDPRWFVEQKLPE